MEEEAEVVSAAVQANGSTSYRGVETMGGTKLMQNVTHFPVGTEPANMT